MNRQARRKLERDAQKHVRLYKNMDELIDECLRVAKEGESGSGIPWQIAFNDMMVAQLNIYAKNNPTNYDDLFYALKLRNIHLIERN